MDSVAPRAGLEPYLPRIVLDWIRDDPDARWREVDGTMAFVDISGFTSLSERLREKGKLGAEEVTAVMNATFAPLLDRAHEYGGSLLKFGGDALFLFFQDEGHARRATRAFWELREELERIGKPETSVGPAELKMHGGLHSGRFQFFLVGDVHRELIVAGPAATTTVEMEMASETGEIVASAATGAEIGDAAGEPRDGGFLVSAAPSADPRPEPLPPLEGVDLAQFVPSAIREHLELDELEPEHRQVTVAFVHFTGVDRLVEGDGAEAAAGAVEHLVSATQRAAQEHNVTFLESDLDRDGGRIVLVGGAPRTGGEDEERVLRTARAIVDAGGELHVRIGVNRGRVFAGEIGTSFRRAYTILGNTAALAARLTARAEPGQVLAPPAVVRRSRTSFETTDAGPFQMKGIAEPVPALAVGPPAGQREVEPRRRLPLVGREREMAVLTASLTPVRMGFGTLVELIGEPGIGKSRVVEELREQAADLHLVPVACQQYEASTPYFPFRDLLSSLLGLGLNGDGPARNTEALRGRLEPIAPDLIPWIPLLAIPLDIDVLPTQETEELQPAFRRARLNGVVATLLSTLLSAPAIVVFEDVHWMDEASSDLLRHLGEQVQTRPWLLCATRRPGATGFLASQAVPPLPALTLRLEPLTADAASALIAASAHEALPQHELAAIAERAGGNPLFLQELVGAAARDEELPENIEAVVTMRIDELSPTDRTLLRYSAVLGASFSGELVERVLAGDASAAVDSDSWARLTEFVERDPYTPGHFRFRHALFRDAAYEGLSFRRRQELHLRVGRAYEELHADHVEEVVELLSLHFARAGAHAEAWRYSLAAGERAQEKFANVEAAEFFRRAVDAARHLPELAPETVALAWEALADVSQLAGAFDDAAAALAEARALAGPLALPGLLRKEGLLREEMGRWSEVLEWYERGLEAVDALPDDLRAQAELAFRVGAAQMRFRHGDYAECARHCRELIPLAQDLGDLKSLAHLYYLLHTVLSFLGDPDRAAFRGLALPIYEELGDLAGQSVVLNNLGVEAYFEGRWNDALELYARSQSFHERLGDAVRVAAAMINIGEIKSDQGHLDEATDLLTEARQIADAAGNRLLSTAARSNLARVAARAGRHDDADTLLREALAAFLEMQAGNFVSEVEARIAELWVLTGFAEEALAQAEATLAAEGIAPALRAMLLRLRGYALAQLRDFEGASACIAESLSCAREAGVEYELALTLEAQARIAERTGARDYEAEGESSSIFERLGVIATPAVPLP